MRKILGLILSLGIIGVLVACSQERTSDSINYGSNSAESVYKTDEFESSSSASRESEMYISSSDKDGLIEDTPNELPLVPYN